MIAYGTISLEKIAGLKSHHPVSALMTFLVRNTTYTLSLSYYRVVQDTLLVSDNYQLCLDFYFGSASIQDAVLP